MNDLADRRRKSEALYRRQLVLAGVAGAVVLAALLLVAWVVAQGPTGPAVVRVAGDGTRVAVPASGSSSLHLWAVVAALGAVGGLLLVLVVHMVRVARFTLSRGAR